MGEAGTHEGMLTNTRSGSPWVEAMSMRTPAPDGDSSTQVG